MFKFKWNNGRATYTVRIPFAFIITGWLLMLLVGILHHNVSDAIPTIGYGLSVLIMLIVQAISWLHSDASA